jgi:hypothetical protein
MAQSHAQARLRSKKGQNKLFFGIINSRLG